MRKKQAFSETLFTSMGGVGLTPREDTEAGVHCLSKMQWAQNVVGTKCKEGGFVGEQVHVKFLFDCFSFPGKEKERHEEGRVGSRKKGKT